MYLNFMSGIFYKLFFFNQDIDINNMKTLKGLALQDILTQVHLYVHRSMLLFLFIFMYISILFYCHSIIKYVYLYY